jgi:hypothetical protein
LQTHFYGQFRYFITVRRCGIVDVTTGITSRASSVAILAAALTASIPASSPVKGEDVSRPFAISVAVQQGGVVLADGAKLRFGYCSQPVALPGSFLRPHRYCQWLAYQAHAPGSVRPNIQMPMHGIQSQPGKWWFRDIFK